MGIEPGDSPGCLCSVMALIGHCICLLLAKNGNTNTCYLRMRKGGHSGEKAGDCPCLRTNQVVTLFFSGPKEAVSLVGAEVAEAGIHKGTHGERIVIHMLG